MEVVHVILVVMIICYFLSFLCMIDFGFNRRSDGGYQGLKDHNPYAYNPPLFLYDPNLVVVPLRRHSFG